VDDLAQFGVPAILFSGGEPLLREDFFELASYANQKGLRTVVSTNATLITDKIAKRLKEVGVVYVGASLDGIGEVNDRFRGKKGAFARAVNGIKSSKQNGLPISLRLTLTKHNADEIDGIFDFVEAESIERVCFYHLAYAGRGRMISKEDLTPSQTRSVIDNILAKTKQLHDKGLKKDILTVAQHADGVYLYLKLLEQDPQRAAKVRELLEWNGGGRYSSGVGIADIDPDGNVHPDQFWQNYTLGNVKERKFSEIWTDSSDPLMAGLKDRLPLLKGRCGACRFQKMCGGSLRVRAAYAYDDPWAEDPACYLTDEEIGIS
jgi:Fe-coproporphyrin III synthase